MIIHLTCERKQVLVNDLGGLAVPLVLLGLLDMLIHISLRLEPVSAALVRAGDTLAGVGHQVILQGLRLLECRRTAWMGAGESWRLSVLAANVTPQVVSQRKSFSTTLFFAEERPFAQVHSVVVAP